MKKRKALEAPPDGIVLKNLEDKGSGVPPPCRVLCDRAGILTAASSVSTVFSVVTILNFPVSSWLISFDQSPPLKCP
jgi:hypothetical protein